MTARPDLVDVWVYRVVNDELQFLFLHRAPHKVLPGLWQGVSGNIEPDERIIDAALRELREETGFGLDDLVSVSTLDFVASFLWEPLDAVMTSVHFGAMVRPAAVAILGREHDEQRWIGFDEAVALAVWPGYREALIRVKENLLDPERERWFRIDAPSRSRAAVD